MDMTLSSRRFMYVSTLFTWLLGLNCVPRHYSSNGPSPQRRMRSLLSARSEGNLILLRVTAMSLSKKLAVVAASLKAWLVSGHIFSLSINILTLYLAGLLFRKNVTTHPYIFFCCLFLISPSVVSGRAGRGSEYQEQEYSDLSQYHQSECDLSLVSYGVCYFYLLGTIHDVIASSTPITNGLSDAYGLLRFLRIRPWNGMWISCIAVSIRWPIIVVRMGAFPWPYLKAREEAR